MRGGGGLLLRVLTAGALEAKDLASLEVRESSRAALWPTSESLT